MLASSTFFSLISSFLYVFIHTFFGFIISLFNTRFFLSCILLLYLPLHKFQYLTQFSFLMLFHPFLINLFLQYMLHYLFMGFFFQSSFFNSTTVTYIFIISFFSSSSSIKVWDKIMLSSIIFVLLFLYFSIFLASNLLPHLHVYFFQRLP